MIPYKILAMRKALLPLERQIMAAEEMDEPVRAFRDAPSVPAKPRTTERRRTF